MVEVLVGKHHFVQVLRDGDFLILEITHPGSAIVDGIGQPIKDFASRQSDMGRSRCYRCAFHSFFRSTVNSESVLHLESLLS